MVPVECPYRDVCTSYRTSKCKVCKHNRKKDYFEPARPYRDWLEAIPRRHPWFDRRVWCRYETLERANYGQIGK